MSLISLFLLTLKNHQWDQFIQGITPLQVQSTGFLHVILSAWCNHSRDFETVAFTLNSFDFHLKLSFEPVIWKATKEREEEASEWAESECTRDRRIYSSSLHGESKSSKAIKSHFMSRLPLLSSLDFARGLWCGTGKFLQNEIESWSSLSDTELRRSYRCWDADW